MNYKLIKAENRKTDILLTVEYIPGRLARAMGHKSTERQFYGSGTVFHSWPNCKRCSTDMEEVLSDFWEYAIEHLLGD